ncbi:unnamed protein product [Bursaphelenchus okinawaensis]|uniref:Major sperm protein n=1 Tax=Bursaphelenchus okinawaensis TaxID=465554 RepID=A0A811L0T9_9BILA|nr:unnamed protein product [Bursaphelenchus okinawaensis]CAG9116603.1 unnamed protein product [Bursaphelenchus okinawaensis]
MSGPLFVVHPSQLLEFKEVIFNNCARFFSRIEIENLSSSRLAYRVRTNAKDVYLVRHNPGFVEKDQKSEVLVFIKPNKSVNAKHRFVVTVAECKEILEEIDRNEFWKKKHERLKLAHWRLSARIPTMDTETTMSMYQSQVKALKIENQMLRNKCEEYANMKKGSDEGQPSEEIEVDMPTVTFPEADNKTVLLIVLCAVILSQIILNALKLFK